MAVVCVPRPWASLLTALEKIAAGGEAMKTFWGLELKNHYYFFLDLPSALVMERMAREEEKEIGGGWEGGEKGKIVTLCVLCSVVGIGPTGSIFSQDYMSRSVASSSVY